MLNSKMLKEKEKIFTIGIHLIDKVQIVLNIDHVLYIKVTVNFKKLR